ncbi:MAG TPA: site-2 protease family protein [Tepidisphaeraceae bacterium]|nr:site-2 protease family protein [Tepidisphaeraceae bacterium]
MDFAYIGLIFLLVFGFGFVIFWHELGHFLAAKWAGVKVEQFAVGFGHAMISWRKGLGVRRGSSATEFNQKIDEYLSQQQTSQHQPSEEIEYRTPEKVDSAIAALGLGETEYRLNWVPLGGYVKMLGQDDLDPNSKSESPRAYNKKSVGKRMVIVSAGVIMNVLLAILMFTLLFRMGFKAPPAVVGTVLTGSPAQEAGLKVGDRILTFDGKFQHDFTKISLNVAMAEKGQPVQMLVKHPDGSEQMLSVTPRTAEGDPSGFLQMGVAPSSELRGPEPDKLLPEDKNLLKNAPVRPGETIIAINGQPVDPVKDYYKLDRALQQGMPVKITVQDTMNHQAEREVKPTFVGNFGAVPLSIAGMGMRTVIDLIQPASPARDKLKPDDIVEQITIQPTNDPIARPTLPKIREILNDAGQNGHKVDMLVIRGGQPVEVKDLEPSMRIGGERRGLGIALRPDDDHAVISDIAAGSPAQRAGIESGSTVKTVGGQPVSNWRDVQRLLAAVSVDTPVEVEVLNPQGQTKKVQLAMNGEQLAQVKSQQYTADLILRELNEVRRTTSPVEAARWGLGETRDLMLQFYQTFRRMFQGSISASNAMGPIGIFHQGSKLANRGADWVIWFLAMISANLAVVNFLPIPIADGGLFTFLILEKITGKPLSPKAQGIAQIAGLALIGGVFLYVTYHDVYRLIF